MTLEESIELTRLRKKLRHERRLSDDEIARVNEIISGDVSAREKSWIRSAARAAGSRWSNSA